MYGHTKTCDIKCLLAIIFGIYSYKGKYFSLLFQELVKQHCILLTHVETVRETIQADLDTVVCVI